MTNFFKNQLTTAMSVTFLFLLLAFFAFMIYSGKKAQKEKEKNDYYEQALTQQAD